MIWLSTLLELDYTRLFLFFISRIFQNRISPKHFVIAILLTTAESWDTQISYVKQQFRSQEKRSQQFQVPVSCSICWTALPPFRFLVKIFIGDLFTSLVRLQIFLNISTSTNGNHALSQVCQIMLRQKFFDLRKRRRELYVQTRTYKSAGRTSLFCLHGKLQGKSMEGWVLAESHCIPATCATAFLKGLSVSVEIFFLLSSHWYIFALWLILGILCKNKKEVVISVFQYWPASNLRASWYRQR